jgi:3-oxoacyl-[acyl-carrier protein] reductase
MTFRNNTKEQIDRILERIPIGRFGDPQEVAELVNFLGSSKNTYITGQCINLDGGYSVT